MRCQRSSKAWCQMKLTLSNQELWQFSTCQSVLSNTGEVQIFPSGSQQIFATCNTTLKKENSMRNNAGTFYSITVQ